MTPTVQRANRDVSLDSVGKHNNDDANQFTNDRSISKCEQTKEASTQKTQEKEEKVSKIMSPNVLLTKERNMKPLPEVSTQKSILQGIRDARTEEPRKVIRL